MISLTYDDGGAESLLRQLDERLSDFTEPLYEILELELLDARHAVAIAKGVQGEPWPPMAAATIRSGRDPSTLLVKSEALLGSLVKDGLRNVFEVTPTSGRAGSAVRHAAWQQDGFDGFPFRPPRAFLIWDESRIGQGPQLGGTSLEIFERFFFE